MRSQVLYTQATCETCLACNLLINSKRNIRVAKDVELDVLNHALRFSKYNFTIGHLDYMARKYGVKINWFVEGRLSYSHIRKKAIHRNVSVYKRKINIPFVDSLLKKSSVILYLDSYVLYGIHHYPHFITVAGKRGKSYKIIDPWDGRIKIVGVRTLSRGIILMTSSPE